MASALGAAVSFLLALLLAIPASASAEQAADYVIENARVFEGSTTPVSDTVAIAGGRVVGVGRREALEIARGPRTKTVDAGGRWLLPGFDDARALVLEGGLGLFEAGRSTAAPGAADRLGALQAALDLARRDGVTTLQEPLGEDADAELAAWRVLAASGAVTARCVFWGRLDDPEGFLRLRRQFKDLPSDRFFFAGVEGAVDGDISAHAAALSRPYADQPDAGASIALTEGDLERLVLRANGLGLRVRLRAEGDGAARMALDAFSVARRSVVARGRVRNTVEGLALLDPRDAARFKSVGVVAVAEFPHEPMDALQAALGPARAARLFDWNALRRAGAALGFASGWPRAPLDPRAGLAAAGISRADAVLCYTRGGAYDFARENRLGSIAPGLPADLVLVGADFFDAPASGLAKVPVDAVFFDGKPVYAADPSLQSALGLSSAK